MPIDPVQLDQARDRSLAAFATAIRDSAAADRAYAPGKWTARQVLWHMADCESTFLDRLRRTLSEAQPLLLVFDENRLTAQLDAAHRDLAIARDLYTASRAYIRAIVTSLPAAAWQQAAVHSVVGKLTVEQQVAKVLWHDDHHRPQAEAALAGRIWTPAPA
jgi:uncharacterized damage-inducible protein DinB